MGEIVIYQNDQNQTQVDVRFENETFWLSLSQIAVLFERDKSVISRHLSNIFKEQELLKDSVVAKNATTANDGKTYQVEFYNLDAILSVGVRTGWFGLVSICLVLLNLDYPCNVSSLSHKPITTLLDYGGQFRIPLG